MNRGPSRNSNPKPKIVLRSAATLLPAAIAVMGGLLSSPHAAAHPGHSLGQHGPLHVVTSPYHLGLLAAVGAALWLGGRCIERRMPRRALQVCGVLALGAAGLLWGLRP
jgi:hypothetical protein